VSISDLYARISPLLAGRPGSSLLGRTHAWLLRRTHGRLGKRFLGVEVLVLRTVGRKSGTKRDSPMFYIRHGDGFAVVASNAASRNVPAWWLNLQAYPDAEALVRGETHRVRARKATDEEATALWPRFVEIYRGFDHYREVAKRELPVVLLEHQAPLS
jgi:deazaflavin-dependent oxidoreductase (nitroreductase family)